MPSLDSEVMYRQRALETRLQAMCDSGELAADLHMGTGQEAIAAGVCAALGPKDMLLTHHRMIGWALARGVPMDLLVRELMGGAMGEMHFRAPAYGFAHSFQLVGTVIPVAAGVAWALKEKGEGGVAVAVCGDAATANGAFHEGLNIAAVNRLPLLVVIEDNGVAGNVTRERYMPGGKWPDIELRAASFIVPSRLVYWTEHIDGVTEKTVKLLALMKEFKKPGVLICETQRLGKHKQGMGDLRSKKEMEALWLRDPLRVASISESRRAEIDAEVEGVIARARVV